MNSEIKNPFEKNEYSFPGRREDEKVIAVIRKHKIVLLGPFSYVAAMSLLPMIFYVVIAPFAFPIFREVPYSHILILLTIIYYGFIWISIFIIWADYYLDLWIVTNQRILNIEQIGFFNRVVSELDLKRIQDITSEVIGMLPTMFGFGNIYIQTAAEEERFALKFVPHPVTVRKIITNAYTASREKDRLVFRDREE